MRHPTPKSIASTLNEISNARLSSYLSFFNPQNDEELYGIYCWNDALSSNFLRLIGIIEISLRNRIHSALSHHIASQNPVGLMGSAASNDWYNHTPLSGKSLSKIKDKTHNSSWVAGNRIYTAKIPIPSGNQIISNMTFGFWPPLFRVNSLPWGNLLPSIVPNHRNSGDVNYWSKWKNREKFIFRLEKICDIRNRVAHFEPLWKLGDLYEEIPLSQTQKIELFAPTTESEALFYLKALYEQRMLTLLQWLSTDRLDDFKISELHQRTLFLLSNDGLNFFKNGSALQESKLSSLSKSWGMKLVMTQRNPVKVIHKKKIIGHYYPNP